MCSLILNKKEDLPREILIGIETADNCSNYVKLVAKKRNLWLENDILRHAIEILKKQGHLPVMLEKCREGNDNRCPKE